MALKDRAVLGGPLTPVVIAQRGELADSLSLDGRTPDLEGLRTVTYGYLFNGTTWDRQRGNVEYTLLNSAARTVATNSGDQTNYNGTGLIVMVNVSLDPAAAAITPTLQIKDSISGGYFTIWTAAAAINAVGLYAYLFAPAGAAGSYTEAVNLRVGRTWRLRMTVADADSMTYSVSAVNLVF